MSLAAWQRASIKRKNKVTGGGVLCGNTKSSRKGCSLRDGQACVRADSQIEAHPRSMMWPHTHTHTNTPECFCASLPPNSTKWNPSLTGAHGPCFTPCWILDVDANTHTCTEMYSQQGWYEDKDRMRRLFFSLSLLAQWVLFHLFIGLLGLCLVLRPAFPSFSAVFFNPVANISLILSTYGRLCPLSCFLSLPFFFS